jgi:hypothetical protein
MSAFPSAMRRTDNDGGKSPNQLEAAACVAIELLAERTITDTEWALMRTNLLEFASILRAWERTASAAFKS